MKHTMKQKIELPTCMPMFTTFNFQGAAGIVASGNKSLKNWFYNNSIMMTCTKRFLTGFTSPQLTVDFTDVFPMNEIEKKQHDIRFIRNDIHTVIKTMLNDGYYVYFVDFDDYYIEGKSFYGQRHFAHDGLICGYDDSNGTYTVAAYNESWVYNIFKTPQKCLDEAMNSIIEEHGIYGILYALKAGGDEVKLDLELIMKNTKEYIGYNLKNTPPDKEGNVFGAAIHDYLGMYLDRLIMGLVAYERVDRRVFRMLWEHKECMQQRILAVERELDTDNSISSEYKTIVNQSNKMRIMYAKYCLKQDTKLLYEVKKNLEIISKKERELLRKLIKLIKREEELWSGIT